LSKFEGLRGMIKKIDSSAARERAQFADYLVKKDV
jgi:hypothetical protein